MIVTKTGERGDQRPGVTGGAQTQIELVGDAFAGGRLENRDQLLHHARSRFARTGGYVASLVIDENKIEVGVVRHLAGAETAHRDRTQRELRSGGMADRDLVA